ncbi:cuticle collagen 1-like [Loxodonta africana]|uniref:cuticle collagen 1-like n=1 Tax=Loxodonta africana TaxID=9785 RepID=UPI0030D51635
MGAPGGHITQARRAQAQAVKVPPGSLRGRRAAPGDSGSAARSPPAGLSSGAIRSPPRGPREPARGWPPRPPPTEPGPSGPGAPPRRPRAPGDTKAAGRLPAGPREVRSAALRGSARGRHAARRPGLPQPSPSGPRSRARRPSNGLRLKCAGTGAPAAPSHPARDVGPRGQRGRRGLNMVARASATPG